MPTPITDVYLLIPGLLCPLAHLDPNQTSVPRLERMLSRADRYAAAGDDLASTLFALFGQPLLPDRDLPEGAVNYLGDISRERDGRATYGAVAVDAKAEGGEPGSNYWLRADPVHLRPDRDRLLLFGADSLQIHQDEASALASQFNEHFAQDDMRLLTPHRARWYLQLEHTPQLITQPLQRVIGRHIESFMPRGDDAGLWRQRMNEMQMLLFQSPVNQQREAAGRLTINGLWVNGGGPLPTPGPVVFDRLFGDDPTLGGLARLHGLGAEPVPTDTASLWGEGAALTVMTQLLEPVLNADPQGWIETLHRLESRLDGLFSGICQAGSSRLRILPCNGQGFTVTSATMRRFWRRQRSLFYYAVTAGN